jgi:mannan endo-1,4-beta-mannosidase
MKNPTIKKRGMLRQRCGSPRLGLTTALVLATALTMSVASASQAHAQTTTTHAPAATSQVDPNTPNAVSINAALPTNATWYSIRNADTGKCLDVRREDNYYSAGARVQQYSCTGTPQQQWTPVPAGDGRYTFVSQRSGMCLDVRGGSTAPGAQIQQWYCYNNSPAQNWLPSEGSLVVQVSGMCLDTNGSAGVMQWYCGGNTAQKWALTDGHR